MASEKVVIVNEADFEKEVVHSEVPVLVDFWAPWCGPCRTVAPVLDQIADEMHGSVKVAKVNVDDNQSLAIRFGVQAIPTFLLFKSGKVVHRAMGALPKAQFQGFINSNLA